MTTIHIHTISYEITNRCVEASWTQGTGGSETGKYPPSQQRNKLMVNCYGHRRKWIWPVLWYYLDICMEKLSKILRNVRTANSLTNIETRNFLNGKSNLIL
jgi:hypothetical protein